MTKTKIASLVVACFTALLISGCENGQLVFSGEERQEAKDGALAQATKRHELFVQCLELAAKIERKGDDDVSDIIHECGNQAKYLANHLSPWN